jgi:hypothetical protein
MATASETQIIMEAKIARFLLKQRMSKVYKPYLVDAIVGKLERFEGIEIPSRIYMKQTKKAGNQ